MTTTKAELIKQKEKIAADIERLKKIIDASSETTFEIIVEDLKEQMIANVNLEDWATLKSNLKDISAIDNTKTFIENQSILLTKKQTEFEDIENQIKNYQISLFETEENQIIDTGFTFNSIALSTGDVYKSNIPNVTNGYWYYLIDKSLEKEGDYCILSNFFPKEERLLQYPKNIELLDATSFVGNIYENDEDGEKARKALEKIQA